VGYGSRDSEAARALEHQGIQPIAVTARIPAKEGLLFYLRLLRNLLSPLPYIVTSHYSLSYARAVRDSLSQFQPDVVLCEWTPYARYVRGLKGFKTLVSTHNVEADIWKRYAENEPNLLRRAYIREQWRKVERFENEALRSTEGMLAVSHQDLERLSTRQSGLQAALIPNGVDLSYFSVMAQPISRRELVFTGSMDWRPNQDAARYFCSEILPLLKQRSEDIECTFVGRSPPDDIRRLANIPGVHISGTVEDVRPYVERAAVYVVPLRIGGGSRLKILEALAMGRAVVSTTIGAEGLDLVDGKHVVLADDAQSFADAVLQLLSDPSRCQSLATEGRKLVETQYGWDALADRLNKFIVEFAR
jgi:glycosyltransferase involved in cell wall biosynthesis